MTDNSRQSADRRRGRRSRAEADAEAEAVPRLRLDVLASSVAQIVVVAGGWLADRALDGWEVNVYVPEKHNVRPLLILGLKPVFLDPVDSLMGSRAQGAVAVTADLLKSYEAVVPGQFMRFSGGAYEIVVFGSGAVTKKVDLRFRSMPHVPSIAASAFKAHALRAAGEATQSHSLPETIRKCSNPGVAAVLNSGHGGRDAAGPLLPIRRLRTVGW